VRDWLLATYPREWSSSSCLSKLSKKKSSQRVGWLD